MSILKQQIEQHCRIYHSEVVAMRRYIHANPELGFQENNTANFICKKLDEYGIPYKRNIAKTGIVGLIEGKRKDKVIALRADMDALPIIETNEVAYKSKNEGVMHACGHDAHTSILLGAAKILNEIKDQLDGSVKLIFQPSEEAFPGGAKMMIEEGVLKNPEVKNVIGEHVLPTLEAGKVGFRSGIYMASTDEIYLTIKGKGGHAATPDLNVDSVIIAAQILVALQQVVSRNAQAWIPSVLSFGRVIADGHTNIIPDEVKIEGTFRTFDEKWRKEAHEKIKQIAQNTAKAMGGECDVRIAHGYPFLINDNLLTEKLKRYAAEYLGIKKVVDLDIRMTAEDFAYFTQALPSCFYRLGTKTKGKEVTNLHTSSFDIDENALYNGMGLMAYMTFRQLEEML
ncbi:MAG: N-acyl-L-amino acid amidohydrolase [Bacteroidetes bacterium CG2_30_33_31]|nr:MAG: N-acyl-L-amino acid amidohydrolase [Bacteroidetes bacterium CG2_30_33_31]